MNKRFLYATILILALVTTGFTKRYYKSECDFDNPALTFSYNRQTDGQFVDWHPTENLIATINNEESSYYLIDPSSGEEVAEIPQGIGPVIIQISPDGQYLAVLGSYFFDFASIPDREIIYGLDFGKLDQQEVGGGVSTTLSWNPDSTQVAFGNRQLHILDVNTHILQTLQPDEDLAGVEAITVGWNLLGDLLAVYNGYDALILLETGTWKIVREIRWEPIYLSLTYPQAPQALSWNPEGTQIAVNHRNIDNFQIYVWDVISGELVTELPICEGEIRALVWSPDGQHLAVSYTRPLQTEIDCLIRIWDMTTYEVVAMTPPQESNITVIDWSPDGQRLVSIDENEMVQVWEMP